MALSPALLLAPLFSLGLQPVDLGATPPEMRSATACAGCHEAAHGEWRGSRHRLSWVNPIFQREYQLRPSPWCVNCHAPTGVNDIADEGINCAVCHVRAGRVLGARHRPGSPHDTDVRVDFGGPALCAGCHQFNFPRMSEEPGDPGRVIGYTAHPMQNTVAEHAAGPHADKGCRDCHAATPGRHAYRGGHDLAMLQRSIAVSLCRAGGELRATVTNRGAGHRIPTGDVHRHFVLRAWRPSAPEALAELVLQRRFEPLADGGKRIIEDTSLAPGESRTLTALLDPAPRPEATSVELRFVYTIDEFPVRPVGEPVWTQVWSGRAVAVELPTCSASPSRPR